VFGIALVGWGMPLVFIGIWPYVLLAIAALFVTGVSNAVLDVAGFTLMQRGIRNEDRVTMFGVMEALLGVGLLAGSLVAPALVAALDIRGALVVAGAILPLLAVVTWRPIRRGATQATFQEERLALLRRNQLFAPLPLTALDRLAESMQPVSFEPEEVLMQKGEPGERYVLIADGTVEVRDDELMLRTCGAGEGVGEIALIRRVPRTATVTALSQVEAYEIDGATFLAALAGPAGRAAAESMADERLASSPTP
jgi:Cyclic nucleotide-binding domain/Major Facilitator Superfamily